MTLNPESNGVTHAIRAPTRERNPFMLFSYPLSPLGSTVRILASVVLLAAMARAQYETATVLGTITDSARLGVTGGRVRLENIQTGVSVSGITGASGDYQFLNVRAGVYKVSAEAVGFKLT